MSILLTVSILRENNRDKSIVFSPFALGASLSAIHCGSDGWTQKQITDILAQNRGPSEVTKVYAEAVQVIREPNLYINVQMMNKVLIKKGFKVKKEWKEQAEQLFSADVESANFEKSEDVANATNASCRLITNGKIQQIVSPQNFSPHIPNILLVSAAYFKGIWPKPIREPMWRDFSGLSGIRREKFLQKTSSDIFINLCDSSVKMAAIPYKDPAYKLWIFLPNENISLRMWLDAIDSTLLNYLMSGAYREKVHVKFPLFKQEYWIPTKRNLNLMGLRQLFTDRAALERISTPSTHVTDVIHKAVFQVDAEIADTDPLESSVTSATSASIPTQLRSISSASSRQTHPPCVQFVANRPFMYLVTVDKKILFCGTFY